MTYEEGFARAADAHRRFLASVPPLTMENTMPLTAEQCARLELVKFAVQQNIPVEHIASFVERGTAIVLAAPKDEAA